MPNYQAVFKTTHAARRWKRCDNYAFAARDAVAPLVMQELPRAVMHLPIAFIPDNGQFMPVAVLGLQSGRNLFVAPDGRWVGGYIPAACRGYPFALADAPDGQRVLVFDEDSGLLGDSEGEPFFDSDGNPAKAVKDVLDFLTRVQANREPTRRICKALAEHQLIQPWPITVRGGDGERRVEGLCRIDEAAMYALPAQAFEALRQAGALPAAYCQLLSMQHLAMLGKLAEAHREAAQPLPATPEGDLDLEFLNNGGTISFGNL